jgi:hypothetical protein
VGGWEKNIGPSSNPRGNHRVRRGANGARAAGAAEVPNLMAGSQADMRSTFIATGPPVQSEWEPARLWSIRLWSIRWRCIRINDTPPRHVPTQWMGSQLRGWCHGSTAMGRSILPATLLRVEGGEHVSTGYGTNCTRVYPRRST